MVGGVGVPLVTMNQSGTGDPATGTYLSAYLSVRGWFWASSLQGDAKLAELVAMMQSLDRLLDPDGDEEADADGSDVYEEDAPGMNVASWGGWTSSMGFSGWMPLEYASPLMLQKCIP